MCTALPWGCRPGRGRAAQVREGCRGRFKVLPARAGTAGPSAPTRPLTFLTPLLPGAINVILELDADLALRGLVPDEGEFEQLLGRRATQVGLDETCVDEVRELLGPGDSGGSQRAPWTGKAQEEPGRPLISKLFSSWLSQPQPQWLPAVPTPLPWPPERGTNKWLSQNLPSRLRAPGTYHFFDLSLGGGFRGMRKRARMGCMSHRAGTQKARHHRSVP